MINVAGLKVFKTVGWLLKGYVLAPAIDSDAAAGWPTMRYRVTYLL